MEKYASKKQNKSLPMTLRLTMDALFCAMFVVLAVFLSVKTPVAEFSFVSVPLFLCAFLVGAPDVILVAFVGAFVEQLCYGLDATFFFWMLPTLVEALIIAAFVWLLKTDALWKQIVCIVTSEIVLTLTNSVVLCALGWLTVGDKGPVFAVLYTLISGPKLIIRMVISLVLVPLLTPVLKKIVGRAVSFGGLYDV